ncbi:MAG: gluconokinase [Planctomycetota bacterium]
MAVTREAEAKGRRSVVVAGVSLAGKSALARRLCGSFEPPLPFVEGDGLHAGSDRRRMSDGHALAEADRSAWLDRVAARIASAPDGGLQVVTCSCLSRASRDVLRRAGPVAFVFLLLSPDEARRRAARRLGAEPAHFFQPARYPALLEGQFRDLEPPTASADTRVLDADGLFGPGALEMEVAGVRRWLVSVHGAGKISSGSPRTPRGGA